MTFQSPKHIEAHYRFPIAVRINVAKTFAIKKKLALVADMASDGNCFCSTCYTGKKHDRVEFRFCCSSHAEGFLKFLSLLAVVGDL